MLSASDYRLALLFCMCTLFFGLHFLLWPFHVPFYCFVFYLFLRSHCSFLSFAVSFAFLLFICFLGLLDFLAFAFSCACFLLYGFVGFCVFAVSSACFWFLDLHFLLLHFVTFLALFIGQNH